MTGPPSARILVVGDEPAIARYLRSGLVRHGFTVLSAKSGEEALAMLEQDEIDLMILDLELPDMDGVELLTLLRVRKLVIPIIVLSVRSQQAAIVEALELGADDYLTKPFGMAELVARIHVARRHYQPFGQDQEPGRPVYRSGDLAVDLDRRVVTVRGEQVHLSPRQYRLLEFLVAHAGKLLTREIILREVWGVSNDVQYLRIYIRALRRIIEPQPDRPVYITTEIGVGYRIRAAD